MIEEKEIGGQLIRGLSAHRSVVAGVGSCSAAPQTEEEQQEEESSLPSPSMPRGLAGPGQLDRCSSSLRFRLFTPDPWPSAACGPSADDSVPGGGAEVGGAAVLGVATLAAWVICAGERWPTSAPACGVRAQSSGLLATAGGSTSSAASRAAARVVRRGQPGCPVPRCAGGDATPRTLDFTWTPPRHPVSRPGQWIRY
eukprot:COSAG01_NODE_2170_length_8236_cov_17.597272_4_plen_198_part_00